MKIVDVRATTCDVPVPRPIVMGDLRYDTRDYIVVEVVTDEGVSGFGFGMARCAPIAEVIERNLKPLLIGKDPLMTEQHWDRMYNLNLLIASRGIFMRALSVVDIALWDIKGKAAGLPIWRLIGGHRTHMPVLMAGGYIAEDRGTAYLGDEVADVLRVDVANAGGFTEAIRICALAAAYGINVSPHVYPEMHVHLTAGLVNVTHVEMTDPAQGIEGLHLLMKNTLEVKNGEAT